MLRMYLSITIFLISSILFGLSLIAQVFRPLDIPVTVGGEVLPHAWAGGVSLPQVQLADCNQDGVGDLLLYDRRGEVLMSFKGSVDENGEVTYTLDKDLAKGFPPINDYMILADFDKDGIPDLFTGHPIINGMRIFKGKYDNNILHFDQVLWPDQVGLGSDAIRFYSKITNRKTLNQIFISSEDIPAVFDVDGDGDLDILTFDMGGFVMHWYNNRSIEWGFGTDSLIMFFEESCWGGFYESGVTPEVSLSPVKGRCYDPSDLQYNLRNDDFRHAGSTVLALDATGNGLTDLILGDISFSELVLLINGGDPQVAWMVDQDVNFPSYDKPYSVQSFPAAFSVDVDQDGFADILAAPNSQQWYQDVNQLWYYRHNGDAQNPKYFFQTEHFLIDKMLDFGSGSVPAFFDYNNDGLLDIVVGVYNRHDQSAQKQASLYLLKNIGDLSDPIFELLDDDFLDLYEICRNLEGFCAFVPTFYDLDGDGDLDLFVATGEGKILYRENLGSSGHGMPFEFGPVELFWQEIIIPRESSILFYDLDGDLLPDLLVGSRQGFVSFYKNVGEPGNPQFINDPNAPENIRMLRGIDSRGNTCITGFAQVQIVYDNGVKKLVLGSDCGHLRIFHIPDNLNETFHEEMNHPIRSLDHGRLVKTAFGDLDGDGFLEMLVGTQRGGLHLYGSRFRNDDLVSSIKENNHRNSSFTVFPNPANEVIHLRIDQPLALPSTLEIYNMQGQMVLSRRLDKLETFIPIDSLKSGIYSLVIKSSHFIDTLKLVKR